MVMHVKIEITNTSVPDVTVVDFFPANHWSIHAGDTVQGAISVIKDADIVTNTCWLRLAHQREEERIDCLHAGHGTIGGSCQYRVALERDSPDSKEVYIAIQRVNEEE